MLEGNIRKFFRISSGITGLTEYVIYQNQPKSAESKVVVYSSATKSENFLNPIDEAAEILIKKPTHRIDRIFYGEGLVLAKHGDAGKMTYVNVDKFAITENAYVLQVKDDYKDSINLKYFMYTQKDLVRECTGSNDRGSNGTLNTTLLYEQDVSFPDVEIQNQIVDEYDKVEELRDFLQKKVDELNELLEN